MLTNSKCANSSQLWPNFAFKNQKVALNFFEKHISVVVAALSSYSYSSNKPQDNTHTDTLTQTSWGLDNDPILKVITLWHSEYDTHTHTHTCHAFKEKKAILTKSLTYKNTQNCVSSWSCYHAEMPVTPSKEQSNKRAVCYTMVTWDWKLSNWLMSGGAMAWKGWRECRGRGKEQGAENCAKLIELN